MALLLALAFVAQTGGPVWKDRREYACASDPDPLVRLECLQKWEREYPETQFVANRRHAYLAVYQQLNRPADVFRVAREILAVDPKNMQALTAMAVFIRRFPTMDWAGQVSSVTAPVWKDRVLDEPPPCAAVAPLVRLECLAKWVPEPQFMAQKRQMLLATYQQLDRPADVLRVAREILAVDPRNMQALTAMTVYIRRFAPEPTAAEVASIKDGARVILADFDGIFDPAKRPPSMSEAKWMETVREIRKYAEAARDWAQGQRVP